MLKVKLFDRVGRIALWVTFICFSSMALLILSIEPPSGSYLEMLTSLNKSRQNLFTFTLVITIMLIGVTAAVTWLIALYSTFRVAGPLFRFARNLEFGHQHELAVPHIKVRNRDHFQEECKLMDESVNTLISHYQALANEVEILAELAKLPTQNQQRIIEQALKIKVLEQELKQ